MMCDFTNYSIDYSHSSNLILQKRSLFEGVVLISNGKKHLAKIQIKYWRPYIHYALKSVKEMYPLEHQKKVKRDPKLKDIVNP